MTENTANRSQSVHTLKTVCSLFHLKLKVSFLQHIFVFFSFSCFSWGKTPAADLPSRGKAQPGPYRLQKYKNRANQAKHILRKNLPILR